jgi:predicted hydrocarbon binding protein
LHVGIVQSLGEFVRSCCSAETQAAYGRLVPAGEVMTFREIPDARVQALVATLAGAEGKTPAELLADYGRHWVKGARTAYPTPFAARDTKAFLHGFGGTHLAARALPGSQPPEIEVIDRGPGRLALRYRSSRRMCGLIRGIVEGVAAGYGERASIAEPECLLAGGTCCTFEVELRPSPAQAAPDRVP